MIEEINEVIRWYTRVIGKGYNDVNELMYQRARLAGYYTTLMTSIGEAKKEWKVQEATRDNKRARIEFEELQKGTAGNKATLIAKAQTSAELKLEKKIEGKYYELYYFSKSVSEVLSAMNQHIAQSKEEWKLMKYINQTEA